MEHHRRTAEAIAEVIASGLDAASISRRQAAAATGIPLTTLTRRLAGHSPFDVRELSALAELLGCPVSDITTEAEALR